MRGIDELQARADGMAVEIVRVAYLRREAQVLVEIHQTRQRQVDALTVVAGEPEIACQLSLIDIDTALVRVSVEVAG